MDLLGNDQGSLSSRTSHQARLSGGSIKFHCEPNQAVAFRAVKSSRPVYPSCRVFAGFQALHQTPRGLASTISTIVTWNIFTLPFSRSRVSLEQFTASPGAGLYGARPGAGPEGPGACSRFVNPSVLPPKELLFHCSSIMDVKVRNLLLGHAAFRATVAEGRGSFSCPRKLAALQFC